MFVICFCFLFQEEVEQLTGHPNSMGTDQTRVEKSGAISSWLWFIRNKGATSCICYYERLYTLCSNDGL